MSSSKSGKRKRADWQLSVPRDGGTRSILKWMAGVAFVVLACIAIVVQVHYWMRKDASAPNSTEGVSVSALQKTESGDPTVKVRPESVPETAAVDVNEQIASLKQKELELAEQLRDQYPNRSEPLMLSGNIHRDYGNSAEAVRYWQQAAALGPSRPDVYEGIAMIAVQKGDYGKAVDYLRKAKELDGRGVTLRSSLAQALMQLGRYDQAMRELQEQIKMFPGSAVAHFLCGQIFLQKKAYERAREQYLKALETNPEHTNSYYGLFTVCARLGEKDKAQEYRKKFNQFKALDMQKLVDHNQRFSDLGWAQRHYAETVFSAAQIHERYGRVPEAALLLDKAAQASSDYSDLLLQIAQWHHMRGRTAESLVLHEQIAKAYPKHGFNSFLLGVLYAQTGRFADAKESFLRSIEHSPESPDAYRELARLYLRTHTATRQAKILAEKAVSLAPVASNYLILSRACDANGDRQSALAAMERAIALDPDNQEYRRMYDAIANRDK